jgi:flagellar hook-associated protein 3 FlgL
MRVNPQYISGLVTALDQTTAREQQISAQMSSGIRVNSLSDDPAAAGQNVLLNSGISADVTFSQTATSTESMLQVSDSTLGSVVSQLTTAISLATQGNNGTLNTSNVQSIAQQLAGVRDEVLALANTTYLGNHIFAGSQTGTQPFVLDTTTTPATVTYQADANITYLQTPNGQKIQLNVPGDQVFTAAGSDVLNTLNRLVADFSTGTPSAAAQADAISLTGALNHVSQQRVIIDDSITRVQAAAAYTQSESTQLLASQTDLIQTDMAQAATQLSTAETQATALSSVIAALDKGSLFDYLR